MSCTNDEIPNGSYNYNTLERGNTPPPSERHSGIRSLLSKRNDPARSDSYDLPVNDPYTDNYSLDLTEVAHGSHMDVASRWSERDFNQNYFQRGHAYSGQLFYHRNAVSMVQGSMESPRYPVEYSPSSARTCSQGVELYSSLHSEPPLYSEVDVSYGYNRSPTSRGNPASYMDSSTMFPPISASPSVHSGMFLMDPVPAPSCPSYQSSTNLHSRQNSGVRGTSCSILSRRRQHVPSVARTVQRSLAQSIAPVLLDPQRTVDSRGLRHHDAGLSGEEAAIRVS